MLPGSCRHPALLVFQPCYGAPLLSLALHVHKMLPKSVGHVELIVPFLSRDEVSTLFTTIFSPLGHSEELAK